MDRSTLPISTHREMPELAEDYRQQTPIPAPLSVTPPAGAPNVLIVLFDDMGFGASSAYGGPCDMPTADRLAEGGLRFSRFHTTALCAPTRAALLSGRNHHHIGMGAIPELATSAPGYDSIRPESMVTIARILQGNGYATAAFGKMHQTPLHEMSHAGPFDRWPTGDGFDRFYGFIGAETNQYSPNLIDGTTRIDPPRTAEEGYHLSEDLVDQASTWIDGLDTLEPGRPWFCYLSYGAVHDPLQVPRSWQEKYAGRFDAGWDDHRHEILARQKALGLVPEDSALAEWGEGVPRWADLTEVERVVACRLMETYAGMAEHADAQTGRLVDTIERLGQLENTLIFYVLGDNGASAEGGLYGTLNQVLHMNHLTDDPQRIHERLEDIGGPDSYAHYPSGWALALNTPYRFAKQVASHYGGTRNGMIVHWPAGITRTGGVRHQWHHCIDVVPTILEAAGIPAPQTVDGIEQDAIDGVSMMYAFDAPDAADRHTRQYFEMFGNRGVYQDGWTAVALHKIPWRRGVQLPPFEDDVWELYDTTSDWTQTRDLAHEHPQKLAELQAVFHAEAQRYNVFPLDDRLNERFVPSAAGRRSLLGGRRSVTFSAATPPMIEDIAPDVKNRSFTLTFDVSILDESQNGVLIAQGGQFGGWAVYLRDGELVYCYNYADLDRVHVRSQQRVRKGDRVIVVDFRYDGEGLGAGADVSLIVDGDQVGSGRLERTLKFNFSIDEMMSIGVDRGSPVTPEYPTGPAGRFGGQLRSVRFDLEDAAAAAPAGEQQRSKLSVH